MAKKRGNPNWGKPDAQAAPVVPTSFEDFVKKLRLSPADYEGSLQLKEWVRKNKDQKYIPDDLLNRPWRNCSCFVTCDEARGNGKMIRGADQRRH